MDVEYEATYSNIDKDEIRRRLSLAGAVLVRPEYQQKRIVFNMPEGHGINGGWLRVRDEGDKITMSLKVMDGSNTIAGQKEVELKIDNFDAAVLLLESIVCARKAFQESTRELWQLDGVDITIDEWPFLEPFVEVEGKSEEAVKSISELLNFDYATALFDSVDVQYSVKYNITIDAINQRTPKIVFEMENPFVNRND
ncbi:MAG: CYTH domain-containing protein [bacterium]|nr:CYTH domain-containing protein [bacterium]